MVSTSKIVDTMAEQALLEDILEESKPPIPKEATNLHFLLFSPFRYEPRQPNGSRFRAVHEPGVFYAAETVRTAAAEVSYWRWRFLHDTAGLERLQPCSFTAFKVPIKTSCIDLREQPFAGESSKWLHPTDYSATQALARIARQADIGAIQYQSVRDPEKHYCVAVLTPLAFAAKKPDAATRTWMLAISTEEAIWMRQDGESFSFRTDRWEIT
ncbi:RES family NAD+ phosphorylase [Pelotalea chapellei]|nr:RES family NAD+ phosphorylase [Pelotalea chapellei]